MSNNIIYEKENRIEISEIGNERLVKSIGSILVECSTIKGHGLEKEDADTASEKLTPFLLENYPKYTINELSNILRNGYALYGIEYSTVSISNCLAIVKKYDDNIYNREKLEEARNKPTEEIQGSPMSRERDFKVSCYKMFKTAKANYEEGKVTDFRIDFSYYLAYHHVLNEVDKSINQTKEERQRIWDEAKEAIPNYKAGEIKLKPLEELSLGIIFEGKPEKQIAEDMLRGRLFHFWAVNHFEVDSRRPKSDPYKSSVTASIKEFFEDKYAEIEENQ